MLDRQLSVPLNELHQDAIGAGEWAGEFYRNDSKVNR